MKLIFITLFFISFCYSSRTRVITNPYTRTTSTVEYTEQGVPFITASNEEDLFFSQGLISAENRIWQIEIYRRWGLGTLAEIFPNALALDKEARRMQWIQIANENIANTPQKYLNRIQYYINGVNEFLAAAQSDPSLLPPEFEQYEAPFPETYTILDTYILVKVLATGLSGDARSEPRNQYIYDTVGSARFNQYFALDPKMPYIVPPYHHSNYSRAGSDVPIQKAKIYDKTKDFDIKQDFPPPVLNEEASIFFGKDYKHEKHLESPLGQFLKTFNDDEFTRASNSWAIHGEHTESGLPLFANDPHLPYTAPIIWIIFGLHIDAPDSKWNHVVGATLVLAPGVGIGRNEYLSWGYTMVQSDNQDLYIMENLPGDRSYRYNGTVKQYDISWELINVKNSAPYNITLYRSVYGPVIPGENNFVSLHWTAQFPIEPSVEAIMDQCEATNQQEYLEAAGKWWSLCFNAVYADKLGNIGYHASGAIPHRQPGDTGKLPKPGDGSMDWLGIAPYNELPNFVNPEEGYIVTANNPVAPPSAETFEIYCNNAPGFRAQRIIDMIDDRINSNTPKIDVAYMQSIQGSVVNLEFSYLYSTVENLQLTEQDDIDWQNSLLNWDGNELISSKEATIFDDFAYCLYNVTFYEIGQSWDDPNMMAMIFNNATASGTGDDISCSYWNQTCLEYASNCFSKTVNKYPIRVPEWGSIPHYATFLHILPVPVSENLFAEQGGSAYTPNAAHSIGPRGPVVAGPSLRFIADMSGQVPNQMVLPGGESGDPTSPHYSDQLPVWAEIQTLDMDWSQFSS